MKTIIWEVQFSGLPKTYKYCKKCKSKTEYHSSELFRVNANQKNVDVWLIYRCSNCKATWNMPIYQRINRAHIGHEELAALMNNDALLAQKYAMDFQLLKQCGAAPEIPEFGISGLLPEPDDEAVTIVINNSVLLPIRLSKVIRRKLGLSASEYGELIASSRLESCEGLDLRRGKLLQTTSIILKG